MVQWLFGKIINFIFIFVHWKQMHFVNTYWSNPLRNEDGERLNETPEELAALKMGDMRYVCKTMVHTNFAFNGSANLQFHHVDGTVSIYPSRRVLSRHDGLQRLLQDPSVEEVSIQRIAAAWGWLIANNPLYTGFEMPMPGQEMEVEEEEHRQENIAFPSSIMAAGEAGPRAGDVQMQELEAGVTAEGEPVSFKDKNLMATVFPHLFPFGRGAFSLWHQKKNLRSLAQAGVPSHTLKEFVKYRLDHFDRTFSHDQRFIAFTSDWIAKDATYGFHMRSTTMRRGARATTGADVLAGE
jgi:hypothetical protein